MENTCSKTTAAILRQKAEDSLKRKSSKSDLPLSEGDSLKLIHELHVYQIELELQNEELLLAKSAALDAAEKYAELYDFAPSGNFTISKDDEIIELNICGSQMLGKERSRLKTSRLGFFISDYTKPIYNLFVEKVFTSKVKESCEVTLSANDNSPLYVLLTGIVIANGEQSLITMVDITARKRAEQALLDSERHYRALVEGMPGIVYSFSNKRGGMFYSDQVNSILGYSPEQLYAQPILWHNSIHPDDIPGVDQIIRNVTTREPFCIEYRIQDAHGNWRWFEDRSTGYHIDGADVILEGLVLDISERKRLRIFLDSVIEQSPVSMWISDDKGTLIRANRALLNQLHISDDELVGKYNIFRDRQIEDQGLMPLVREVFEKGSTVRFTTEYDTSLVQYLELKRSKHAILDVTISAVFDSEGKVVNAIIQHLDVTLQKQAEAALRESDERYRLLFESATDALFLIAADTGMVFKANSMASALYGYDSEELLTKRSMDLSAEPEETRRLIHEVQTSPDRILSIPLRFHRKKDGTVFPVEITSRAFPLQGRQILFVTVRDITERKQAEAEKAKIEVQNWQLQKTESLNRMAGAVAHHFNNQLQVVMGNLEMAMDDQPQGSNTLLTLSEALKATRKAAEVSGLMITYRGQAPGKQTPLDLREICRKNLPMLQAAAPKGLALKTGVMKIMLTQQLKGLRETINRVLANKA